MKIDLAEVYVSDSGMLEPTEPPRPLSRWTRFMLRLPTLWLKWQFRKVWKSARIETG